MTFLVERYFIFALDEKAAKYSCSQNAHLESWYVVVTLLHLLLNWFNYSWLNSVS